MTGPVGVRLEARLTKAKVGTKLAIFAWVTYPDPEDPEVTREDVVEFAAGDVFADSGINPTDVAHYLAGFPTGFPDPL